MNKLDIPEFTSYEEETAFWDQLDTAPFMENDGEWFQFETVPKRAIRIAILPELAGELIQLARNKGVSLETLVNAFLIERVKSLSV
jgi:hypothetical protein